MRKILPLLPKPSRYIGIEEGSIIKNAEDIHLRIGLAFPDLYEVGMSYLGQKILYNILNAKETWWAERIFAPCAETGKILFNTPDLSNPNETKKTLLCTLEGNCPLNKLDVLGFSITHELCYTNILYMLDLGGIPLRSEQRAKDALNGKHYPLIIAGGSCTLSAEPIAPFVDLMMLGDGEEIIIEVMELLDKSKKQGWSRQQYLEEASKISGVYIPEFFEVEKNTLNPDNSHNHVLESVRLKPAIKQKNSQITRRIVADLNKIEYPAEQTIPFGAVHKRLTLEIARGCTRGCRFCQAGMVYRPVRERSVENLSNILEDCLQKTGYDDVSFLSLSTGDFSALKTLFLKTSERCAKEQISISLPSLRVGSIDDSIMERLASIRRTGVTLAPEAGSQRLRDVINKGVTEEELILHVQKLFEHGWQQVKLYFMIGLPTETKEDILAIVDLCRKVRDAAGPGVKRLQVTAAISPFVPKPHTPFQWEEQLSYEETRERIGWLLEAFKGEKRLKMRWHEPKTSFLEGVFSRGSRKLADVIETAYNKGAIFASWMEHFKLEPWLEALEEHGLKAEDFLAERPVELALPWEHLNAGISKEFLLRERQKALGEKISPDCRYGACQVCGVCDRPNSVSLLHEPETSESNQLSYQNILNYQQRDQETHKPKFDEKGRVVERQIKQNTPEPEITKEVAGKKAKPPKIDATLAHKAAHYVITYSKLDKSAYLSQLELQSLFDLALRRAGVGLSFSQGFHPLPLLSFGRALPVAVESHCEVLGIHLREYLSAEEVYKRLNPHLLRGMQIINVEELPINTKLKQSSGEEYLLEFTEGQKIEDIIQHWQEFISNPSYSWTRTTKNGERTTDIRPLFKEIKINKTSIKIIFDWNETYISPLKLCLEVSKLDNPALIRLIKMKNV
ncbi:TIGR03960 family B12-binding radical SAM protein [Desulfovibrio litoralis]|uniref:Radical SAM-linked protein/radical SAM family uncharacterized protein n=1 Tax=Desulfovibrio litoralis DSM 11393 TaxID=1121455 RepID=A0A1M7TK61_9BACT|nr:TIGR03960 family B12-binding radical SAM protein [Desulfovibrio litoralis]SHN71086.1 radical SAM-linked protein/radical SAM family uncharacterized protein [Desulfovibrio litoralis DSM 11393]